MKKIRATWAIGDVHGRLKTLEALVARLDFDPSLDRLWMVGDLVQRGPDSLGVLRWARRASKRWGDRFACVLGNHDLGLLAAASGLREPNPEARAVLDAPDRDKLIRWLRRLPLAVHSRRLLLVHAGLWPHWSAKDAEAWAHHVHERLQSDDDLLSEAVKGKKKCHRATSTASPGAKPSTEDLRRALHAFTVLRMIEPGGCASSFKGPPEDAPKGHTPWFEQPSRKSSNHHVVCGHWAALGLRLLDGVSALDSGAAWDGPLSACRLEDRQLVQQENLDVAE